MNKVAGIEKRKEKIFRIRQAIKMQAEIIHRTTKLEKKLYFAHPLSKCGGCLLAYCNGMIDFRDIEIHR